MNEYVVTLSYAKVSAFETTVSAPSEAIAKHQAQTLAKMSGWPETPKKITVRQV